MELRGYDDWKTTEPVEICYHPPCPHGHCEICEGKECCEQCLIESEEMEFDEQCLECIERFDVIGGNQ